MSTLLPGPTRASLLIGEGEKVSVAPVDLKELGANDDYQNEDDEDELPYHGRQVFCQNSLLSSEFDL